MTRKLSKPMTGAGTRKLPPAKTVKKPVHAPLLDTSSSSGITDHSSLAQSSFEGSRSGFQSVSDFPSDDDVRSPSISTQERTFDRSPRPPSLSQTLTATTPRRTISPSAGRTTTSMTTDPHATTSATAHGSNTSTTETGARAKSPVKKRATTSMTTGPQPTKSALNTSTRRTESPSVSVRRAKPSIAVRGKKATAAGTRSPSRSSAKRAKTSASSRRSLSQNSGMDQGSPTRDPSPERPIVPERKKSNPPARDPSPERPIVPQRKKSNPPARDPSPERPIVPQRKKSNPPARDPSPERPIVPQRKKSNPKRTAQDPSPVRHKKKGKLYRPQNVLREIKYLQSTEMNLIPKITFHRVCREITQGLTARDFRYTGGALLALQTAAEAFMCGFFEDSYLLAAHAKRVTLLEKDMRLAYRIRGENRAHFSLN